MPTKTYQKISSVTLGSNQGTVTFSSIPQTYTDLRLVIRGGYVDNGFLFGVRVGNGTVDSGTNYSYTTFRGNNTAVSSVNKNGMVMGALSVQGANNLNNVITADFFNYSSTTIAKNWLSRAGNAGEPGVDGLINLWNSTSAITSIAIAESGDGGTGSFNYGNLLAGTTLTLYGIL